MSLGDVQLSENDLMKAMLSDYYRQHKEAVREGAFPYKTPETAT